MRTLSSEAITYTSGPEEDAEDLSGSSGSHRDTTDLGSSEQSERGDSGMLEHSQRSDKIISVSRIIFFTVLCVSAAVCAGLAFALYRGEERELFERAFQNQAEEMVLYTSNNVDTAFATLRSLSTSTTTLVKKKMTSSVPGFVELPDITYHLGLARNSTDALVIAYMPKVLNENYDEWIQYSEENKDWISASQPGGPISTVPEITPYIWEWGEDLNFTGSNTDNDGENAMDTNDSSQEPVKNRALRGLQRSYDCSQNYFDRRNLQHQPSTTGDGTSENQEIGTIEDVPKVKVPSPRNASYFTPVWQMVPVPVINETHRGVSIVNYNLRDRTVFEKASDFMQYARSPVFLDVCDQAAWFNIEGNTEVLQTVIAFPVFQDFTGGAPIAGFFTAIIPWIEFFDNNLSSDIDEIMVVMENTCDEVFTVSVSGKGVEIAGEEDLHDPKYDHMGMEARFAQNYNREDLLEYGDICIYTMMVYPTSSYEDSYMTKRPLMVSILIVMVFAFTSLAFMLFDCLVTRRQARLLNTALRQNAIVNSLFPKSVQKKLMEEADVLVDTKRDKKPYRRTLTTFLDDDGHVEENKIAMDSKPIADLFPNTTIMFADISGFTAWSSAREPEAVFTLLETIYRAFDKIAKRRRVFKVEVVGDCYVAVCGLPTPRKDHFTIMCKFAEECLLAMQVLVKELEVQLGPDTGDLSLRIGLNSGPVVAGVLRGEKSRFQLFGDTMNTASRMESTGVPNRIQMSQATADLLIEHGKEHWIMKRVDKVEAKGKGEMTTYFLLSSKKKSSSDGLTQTNVSVNDEVALSKGNQEGKAKRTLKKNRVADWVVEMLGKLLKEMAIKRKLTGGRPDSIQIIEELEKATQGGGSSMDTTGTTVIDEIADCLNLPRYAANGATPNDTGSSTGLDNEVIDELRDYIYSIADMYRKNPFHNFEHASHVSMSCIKLLNRIASRDDQYEDGNDHTFGICCDPLTSFAIVFAALIHDVDHSGAPNAQLLKENSPMASLYKNKSIAEQNSIDIGWGLLMEPTYANLRRHIYTTRAEFKSFRQLVVNCVMATDIVDKDLIKARNERWDLAFSPADGRENDYMTIGDATQRKSIREVDNRKATVVIEHLIQLSDIAHTMQHWHIYRRWNERLFEESYVAYAERRAEKNPVENWYQGELGFYDYYIIPLANKIKQCQVFGVSSDEYLSYALQNRQEWEARGREVVEEMAKKYEAIHNAGISRQLLKMEKNVAVFGQSLTTGIKCEE